MTRGGLGGCGGENSLSESVAVAKSSEKLERGPPVGTVFPTNAMGDRASGPSLEGFRFSFCIFGG